MDPLRRDQLDAWCVDAARRRGEPLPARGERDGDELMLERGKGT